MFNRTGAAAALAVAALSLVACSDEARDELGETVDSAVDDVQDVADSVVENVQEEAGEAVDAAMETAARNLAATQGEAAFEDAGQPIDESGLDCQATATDDASNIDITCSGTTEDGGAAELTGRTTELPGASLTELVGDFTGTVDGSEVFTTERLGA